MGSILSTNGPSGKPGTIQDGPTKPQGTVPEEIDHAMNPMLFFNSIGVVKTRGLEILSLDCVMPFKTEAERQEQWDSLSADERRGATKDVEEAFDKVAADAGLPPAKVEQSNAPTAAPSTRSPQIKPPSQRGISTRPPGRYWSKLPEVVRWILFFPTVLLVWGAANLVWLVAMWVAELFGYGPATEFWWMVSGAFFSASIIFPVVFALAPRGQRIAGWAFYVAFMTLNSIVLLLMLARLLATSGGLGDALKPPAGVVGWERKDWGDLAQAVVWLTIGTWRAAGAGQGRAAPKGSLDARQRSRKMRFGANRTWNPGGRLL